MSWRCDDLYARKVGKRLRVGDQGGYYNKLLSYYPKRKHVHFIRQEEIAETAYFLASPMVAPITEVCLPVDFGVSASN